MLTIEEVLKRPLFQEAQLVAGHAGATRIVQWVHIGEIPHLAEFLRGGELVLSTGVGLSTHEARHHFVLGLIESGAAGLVLELGRYFPETPDDILKLADRHQFPIIIFQNAVRFLDLSYALNTLIISEHHQLLDELEALSLKIRQVLLNTEGPEALLNAFQDVVNRPIWYHSRRADRDDIILGQWPRFPIPSLSPVLHPTIEPSADQWYIHQSIMVFDNPVGDIYVQGNGPLLEERLYLSVDRLTAALAQDFIRVETLEKSVRREESAMLEALFFHESVSLALFKRFNSRYALGGRERFRVGMADTSITSTISDLAKDMANHIRLLQLDESDRTLVVILGGAAHIESLLDKLGRQVSRTGGIGWSRLHKFAETIKEGLSEAHDAWIVSHLPAQSSVTRYENLGLYRWILATSKEQLQALVIEPELGALLHNPSVRSSQLLETLEVVVSGAASKSDAAEHLHIHRQTLYARLHHLETILGPDFLSAQRRSAIEAAILAVRFLEWSLPDHDS